MRPSQHFIPDESNVVSYVLLPLAAPATDDVRELAGQIACARARAELGPSGRCHFSVFEEWPEMLNALGAECPSEVVSDFYREWHSREHSIGIVHVWTPPDAPDPVRLN